MVLLRTLLGLTECSVVGFCPSVVVTPSEIACSGLRQSPPPTELTRTATSVRGGDGS